MEIIDVEKPPNKLNTTIPFYPEVNNTGVPLPHFIPKVPQNHFFYKNGLSKIIPRLHVKVHSNIDQCHELWEEFSPKESLFDVWDFRMAWYQGYGHTPYFYTLYEESKPQGVLPLWYDTSKKRFEWFGSYWMEDSKILVKDEHIVDLLFAIAPTPIHLNAIDIKSDWSEKKVFKELQQDEPKNLKDISKFSSMEDFLSSCNKKDRYNLRADYNHIMDLNPHVKITTQKNVELIESLIKMNTSRFDGVYNDDSDFEVPERRETYRNMVRNSGDYKIKFIEVYIQNYLAAIDFCIEYKDRYYMMKGGNDLNRFRGVGNFILYYEFEDAIKNGFKTIDSLQEDYGWKHKYFTQVPTHFWEVK